MELVNSILTYFNRNRYFLALLLCIHVFYFGCALQFGDIYTLDSDEYLQTAVNLKLHGEVYNYFWTSPLRPEYYSLRPPLYGLFILLAKLIYNSDFTVLLFQNLISIFIWLYFVALLKAIGIQKHVHLVVITTLTLFPTQMILVNSIMADLLLQLWIVLLFGCVVFYVKTKKVSYVIWYNILLVLAVYTKPVFVYFWIPNILLLVLLIREKRRTIVFLSALLLPISIFIWCKRNEAKTGLFHFSSIKTQSILEVNAGYVLAQLYGKERAIEIKDSIMSHANHIEDYSKRVDYINHEAINVIENNWLLYAKVHAQGMLNFMLAAGRNDLVDFFPQKPEKEISLTDEFDKKGLKGISYYLSQVNLWLLIFMLCSVAFNILILFSTIYFGFNSSVDLRIRFFVSFLVFFVCFMSGPGGLARYRMCVIPLMFINLPFFYSLLKNKLASISLLNAFAPKP